TTARRRIGALGFGSRAPVAYTAADVTFLGEVAKLVAVAVDNALNFDEAQATQRQLSTERDHLRLLLEVTNAMVANLDLPGLVDGDRGLGTLTVGNHQPDAFTPASVAMIEAVARQVAMAVANALAFREIAQLTERLAEERVYLESEIRAEHPFGEIVGESRPLRDVLQHVETVAPTDATVLVLGETGTGKELIARAVHDRSGRRERTFVKINCAAIPS